jgi:hypothetical protein
MCAADDGVAFIGPKLANAGTALLDVMRSGILVLNTHPEIASTRSFGAGGVTQDRILLLERLHPVISVNINAAQAARDVPQSDTDVTSPIQFGQILRVAHVGSGEIAPFDGGFFGAFTTGQQQDVGAE